MPGRACEDVCEGEADGWVVVPVAVPAPWTLLVGTVYSDEEKLRLVAHDFFLMR